MKKILITARSFGKADPSIFKRFSAFGFTPVTKQHAAILSKEQMKEEIAEAFGIIVGVDPLDGEVLSAAKNLRAVAKYGVGTDNIDLAYCRRHGISVSVTAGANTEAVADYAVCLMLAVARQIVEIDSKCRAGDWSKVMGLDMHGKVLGIMGLGAIGKAVAKRARGFDMCVLAFDTRWDVTYASANGITYATPEEIYRVCDFISLHLPLTKETYKIVDANAFSAMKPTAILVNTARGGLVDETALVRALTERTIAGAGLDVYSAEPPVCPEMYTLKNLIMGSHCAASTSNASALMSRMATENLLNDLTALCS